MFAQSCWFVVERIGNAWMIRFQLPFKWRILHRRPPGIGELSLVPGLEEASNAYSAGGAAALWNLPIADSFAVVRKGGPDLDRTFVLSIRQKLRKLSEFNVAKLIPIRRGCPCLIVRRWF